MSENAVNANLAAFRKHIDELDDNIIRLLAERIGVVEKVGAMKRSEAPGICPIRPGREAEQLRRIMRQFENIRDDVLFPAAGAALWRIIIGMSTSIEAAPLKLSAFTPIGDRDLYWLAREYFGPFVSVVRQPQINRVIGDVMDGKASVGVVPVPRGSDATNWWRTSWKKERKYRKYLRAFLSSISIRRGGMRRRGWPSPAFNPSRRGMTCRCG